MHRILPPIADKCFVERCTRLAVGRRVVCNFHLLIELFVVVCVAGLLGVSVTKLIAWGMR